MNNDPRFKGEREARAVRKYIYSGGRVEGQCKGANKSVQTGHKPGHEEEEGRSQLFRVFINGPGEEGPPIRSNIVSSVANITASSGSTPCNARWDVNGAAGSPNEDKSYPKWRPYLFPAPPFPFFPHSSSAPFVPPPFIERN